MKSSFWGKYSFPESKKENVSMGFIGFRLVLMLNLFLLIVIRDITPTSMTVLSPLFFSTQMINFQEAFFCFNLIMKLLKFSRSNRLKKTRKDFTPRQIVQSYCKQKEDEFGKDVMAT